MTMGTVRGTEIRSTWDLAPGRRLGDDPEGRSPIRACSSRISPESNRGVPPMLRRLLVSAAALLVALATGPAPVLAAPERPLNVLFLLVDDLRPELGCYGNAG